MNRIVVYILLISPFLLKSQFAPCVGLPGTTAIAKDSSVFKAWASGYKASLGWLDIANKNLGKPTIGDNISPIGLAGTNGVLSLGDRGEAILTFDYPISNGVGADFAVFENSFNNTFLELAFVEVSSDGVHFVRFPATSLSDTIVQFDNNASMDATKLNNLAGKYKANYGTPFDLEELKDSVGLNMHAITHVKIVDVVGSINPMLGSRDAKNNLINDPYPTPYPSAGFDLDAVGVINSDALGLEEATINVSIFPNPSQGVFTINVFGENRVEVYTLIGEKLVDQNFIDTTKVDLIAFPKGMYFIVINGVGYKVMLEN
jgi:hypothetical protein